MNQDRIVIERAAEIALDFLLPAEREQVMHDISGLVEKMLNPEANERRVEEPSELHLAPTLGRLRIVYTRRADGAIVVQDVVNQGIIDRYFRKSAPVA